MNTDWQEMNTAPLDEYVLLWNNNTVELGYRTENCDSESGGPDKYIWFGNYLDKDGFTIEFNPTFWMPLPEPPGFLPMTPERLEENRVWMEKFLNIR